MQGVLHKYSRFVQKREPGSTVSPGSVCFFLAFLQALWTILVPTSPPGPRGGRFIHCMQELYIPLPLLPALVPAADGPVEQHPQAADRRRGHKDDDGEQVLLGA